jgi:D-ribulokinase
MPDLFLGIDIGTSGARAIVIDAGGEVRAGGKAAMSAFGPDPRDPAAWWAAVRSAVSQALSDIRPSDIRALSVDGTSGTMLGINEDGSPKGKAVMYNDACGDAGVLARIDAAAPEDSAARGANSALARAMLLSADRPTRIVHQADWIANRFSGRWVSDENNALKTGYDLMSRCWPDWIARTGFETRLLPTVIEPGEAVCRISRNAVEAFGLSAETLVVAGTTDGCASFVATGADTPGDGVSALGTTLTIKMLSDRPVSAPEFGIYSHRILGHWLAGGASNTGGNVLLHFFTPEQLGALSGTIDPETDSDLDYYPLVRPGERFPIADPDLKPRLEPRPEDDRIFLKGLFDGIARIEAMAYKRLEELGTPRLTSVRSVGGGAANDVWTRMRARRLGVPMRPPLSGEAAYGTALLALRGAR